MSAFALVTLFDHLTPPAPREQNRAQKRNRREPSNRYKFTRRCKANAYQARVWQNTRDGFVNLGLFTVMEYGDDREWAASRASKEFTRFYQPHLPGHGMRETFAHLRRKGFIASHILPPRVEREGDEYVGRVNIRGRSFETPKLPDPWLAYELVQEWLEQAFPKKPTVLDLCEQRRQEREDRRALLVTLADFVSAA